MNYIYRKITIDQFSDKILNDIIEIQSDVLPDDGYDDDFWYKIIATSSSSYIVYDMKDNNEVPIGYIVDAYLPEEGAYHIIASFGVKKDYQNKKIGTQLLNLCLEGLKKKIQINKKNGINREIKLQVRFSNPDSKRFYERNGFYCTKILYHYYSKLSNDMESSDDSSLDNDPNNLDDLFEHGYEMIYTDNPSKRYSRI
jgi:ribosomal protein S18 acetylase RimI-like enzyme